MNNLRFFLPLLSLVLALTTACQGNGSAADGNTDSLAAAKDTVFLPKDDADLHLTKNSLRRRSITMKAVSCGVALAMVQTFEGGGCSILN